MRDKRKRRLFRLLAIVSSTLLTVVLLEIASAIGLHYLPDLEKVAPQELRDEMLLTGKSCRSIPDPYIQWRPMPAQKSRYAEVNSHGLRGGEITTEPAADTVRIIVLGGSVAWGYTSRNDADTLATCIESYLSTHDDLPEAWDGKSVEVLNAGVPAYVSWQEALYYGIYLRKLNARVVICVDGFNDVCAALLTGKAGVPMSYDDSASRSERVTLLGALREWFEHRLERMKVTRLFRRLRPPSLEQFSPALVEEVAEAYRSSLSHLRDLAKLEGARLMVVLQPVALLPATKALTDFEKTALTWQRGNIVGKEKYVVGCYAAFKKVYERLGLRYPKMILFDATRVFEDVRDNIFVDDCHLTPKGRKILARAIGQVLVAGLKK